MFINETLNFLSQLVALATSEKEKQEAKDNFDQFVYKNWYSLLLRDQLKLSGDTDGEEYSNK
jgi:hypothetical protein